MKRYIKLFEDFDPDEFLDDFDALPYAKKNARLVKEVITNLGEYNTWSATAEIDFGQWTQHDYEELKKIILNYFYEYEPDHRIIIDNLSIEVETWDEDDMYDGEEEDEDGSRVINYGETRNILFTIYSKKSINEETVYSLIDDYVSNRVLSLTDLEKN